MPLEIDHCGSYDNVQFNAPIAANLRTEAAMRRWITRFVVSHEAGFSVRMTALHLVGKQSGHF